MALFKDSSREFDLTKEEDVSIKRGDWKLM